MKLYNFPADQLTLYVAKKDGEWLKSDDPDVLQLENGETPHGITVLVNKMNPTFCIGNAAFGFPGEDDAGEDEIHILVDVPQDVNPSGPRYYRNPRNSAFYAVVSFLFMAWVFCNIFTIGEWFIIQEGRKVALWECVNEILLRVSLFVMTAFLAWNWYWEARSEEEQSEEEQSEEEQSCLHLGYGSIV